MTHRDPARTVPSTISLMSTLRAMRSDHVDVAALTRTMGFGIPTLLEHVTAQRAANALPDAQFVDVSYDDLVRAPEATMARVYDRLGWSFTDDVRDRITAYLASKPKGAHGAHRYSAADFGLDADDLRARSAGYCDRYHVVPE
jgi:hypothetical protein